MKVLMLNSSDTSGGAARAAFRLHRGLREIGIESGMLVQSKKSDDPSVIGPSSEMAKMLAMLRPHLVQRPDGFGKRMGASVGNSGG